MDPERWRRAREIFDAAIETSPGERSSYLDDACAGDDELRETVARLIADATGPEDSWLDGGVAEPLVRRALARHSLEGQRIGDYLIRGVLGSGGMATVLEAEQQHPKRTVALKIMRFGLISDVARRRFEYESEILGSLRHPGIAQVYASGTHHDSMTGQDLPYFAMEFVEGARTLKAFVEEEGCDLQRTLRLIVSICQAVHYGHLRGFIHRDLKPQNILVDVQGRPKIIDFGIARATGPESDEQTLRTRQGEILGTLHYMSPEQIADDGQDLDLRCDIYALGVILYELVAGCLPFDFKGKAITAAIEVIRHDMPLRPSSFGSRFSGLAQAEDLDWIIMQAMEKDPDRRYASVSGLAAEIERVLENQPILARPPSRLYLAKKFVKRHRVAVTAAAIVLISLVVGITMTSLSLARTRQAEKEVRESLAAARLEADTHRAVNDFLKEMLSAVNPYVDGREVKMIDLLDRAAARAENLYADRPPYAAALSVTLGSTYIGIGQIETAIEHLEHGAEIGRKHLGPKHHLTLSSLHNLAVCYLKLGKIERAEELATQALEGRKTLFGLMHRHTASSLVVLALIAQKKNELDKAESRYTEAREIYLSLLTPGSQQVVQASSGLGAIYQALGRDREAEGMLRFAKEHGEKELGPDHPSVLTANHNLGVLLLEQEKLEEATEALQDVLAVQERVLGKNHAETLTTLSNVASALQKLGRAGDAEERYRDMIARRKASGQFKHYMTAVALNNLGVCLESQDRLEEAEKSFGEALSLLEECRIPPQHWLTAAFRKGLAVVHTKQKRYAEAETALEESIRIYEKSSGDQEARIHTALEALAKLYDAWGKPELAQQVLERMAQR